MSSGLTVTFNDPRRFGLMDLARADARADARKGRARGARANARTGPLQDAPAHARPSHDAVARLGPEPLARAFTAAALARRVAGRRTSLKVVLLDQTVVAGIGNIYASEALHLARLSPFRAASSLATRAGTPTDDCRRLVAAIKTVLRRAIALDGDDPARGHRFRVYEREGERCVTAGCDGTIARVWQAGRSTFYCRVCQR
jgi:formamidopyrimidine-DNA glycosylase